MKHFILTTTFPALVVLVAGYGMLPAVTEAAPMADSAEITKILADVKSRSSELLRDSEDLRTFTLSKLNWESYAGKIETIKGHVNAAGKLVARLKELETSGSAAQQDVVKRLEPLLQELASNTDATIKHLNDNKAKTHFPPFKDYVTANYELAKDLDALIRDSVAYGEAKAKAEALSSKM